MRLLLAAFVLSVTLTPAVADTCGIVPITPIPPVGCTSMQAQCVCDASGCHWQFVCVR